MMTYPTDMTRVRRTLESLAHGVKAMELAQWMKST